MSEALVQLSGRCEAATGPSFELEREIADAVWRAKWGKRRPKDIAPQPCTASLDAAMTLVPEGCGWTAGWGQARADEPMGAAVVGRNARFIGYGANYDAIAYGEAATPALALTAAALRALAKEPTP